MTEKEKCPTALEGAAGQDQEHSTTKSDSNSPTRGVKTSDGRTRNFTTVFYPESAPENWREILSELCVPCVVSPLHDQDKNPDGEPKKPHWHVMLMFSGKKSIKQVQDIISKFGGVGCQPVQDTRSMARYFCHLDNPSKAHYSVDDVQQFGGVDYLDLIASSSDKFKAIAEMEDWCDDNNIVSYRDLCRYARRERPDWHRLLCSCCSVHMTSYLKSAAWTDQVAGSRLP